jgi:hypothetical protein
MDRQRLYAELNDVQAERMFVENVMRLGKEYRYLDYHVGSFFFI